MTLRPPLIPDAPASIQKGTPLKVLLNPQAIQCLAQNIQYVHRDFAVKAFCDFAQSGLEPLELMQRAQHIALALKEFLPQNYTDAITILCGSLTPEKTDTDSSGLAGFFYLPHSFFISEFGQDTQYNGGHDPFDLSMDAMQALTTRFTAEFAIRPYLIGQQGRTLTKILEWVTHPNPHIRRLCTEGTRPKLPWGKRIPAFIADPSPTLPILELLKDDESLYVRRSVANHLGDIAKDHPDTVFSLCESWLSTGASKELKWLIRHAVRHPAQKGHTRACEIRQAAKAR
ncbi:DNA alkylation repair protein [Bowmanella sp. Y26]|uniref:DNA alkylation repair protein n=1 Tax=Bowmanella yangjiangensis TaxID=2811230 RepID=UPI001BDDBCB6|nr:DNA alkylation repair protein [Bowmanella yangjiangensis]MBT1065893.1 DNA alkylation repair protein [Bowmanella yangjiangensis]